MENRSNGDGEVDGEAPTLRCLGQVAADDEPYAEVDARYERGDGPVERVIVEREAVGEDRVDAHIEPPPPTPCRARPRRRTAYVDVGACADG